MRRVSLFFIMHFEKQIKIIVQKEKNTKVEELAALYKLKQWVMGEYKDAGGDSCML